MVGAIIYQIISWYKKYSLISFIILAFISSIVTILFLLKPEYFFLAICISIIFICAFIYTESWKKGKDDFRINSKNFKIINYFAAENISFLVISVFYIFYITPLMILIYFTWGVDLESLLKLSVIIIMAFVTMGNLTLISNKLKTENKLLFLFYLFSIFDILTFFIPYIKFVNPFYMIWVTVKYASNYFFIHLLLNILINILLLGLRYFQELKFDEVYGQE